MTVIHSILSVLNIGKDIENDDERVREGDSFSISVANFVCLKGKRH